MTELEPLITGGFAGVNVLLLLILTVMWVRNYRTFRTSLILGLITFGVVLLIENALALYLLFSTGMVYSMDAEVQRTLAILRTLEFIAIVTLTYVTVK
ncbi:hypothetical protein [Haladaptatus sp. DFWS20]|uniref:hypothetical protein n=1 Tax=Haladaptatus sp. DFWS20 TaxID=3403467 RepID=UPI003EBC4D0D